LAVALAALATLPVAFSAPSPVYRVDHVIDGDTIALRGGARVRLVQIDTPEVYFGVECYGKKAAEATKTLLRPGTLVRLSPEPATDRVDQYGRQLRYVVRVRDGLNVKLRLVAAGAAAPTSTRVALAGTPVGWRRSPSRRGHGGWACGCVPAHDQQPLPGNRHGKVIREADGVSPAGWSPLSLVRCHSGRRT
jgi:endonuclease YncB( thermonuclease family)